MSRLTCRRHKTIPATPGTLHGAPRLGICGVSCRNDSPKGRKQNAHRVRANHNQILQPSDVLEGRSALVSTLTSLSYTRTHILPLSLTHTTLTHRTTPREDEVIKETLRRSTRSKKPPSHFKPAQQTATPRPSKKKTNHCPTPGSQSSGASSDIPSSASAGLTHMLSQVLKQQ